jgi:hypothetical protein
VLHIKNPQLLFKTKSQVLLLTTQLAKSLLPRILLFLGISLKNKASLFEKKIIQYFDCFGSYPKTVSFNNCEKSLSLSNTVLF